MIMKVLKWVLVGIVLVGVGQAVVLPLLGRAERNEVLAVSTLRRIAAAQNSYASSCGKGGFTDSLKVLAEVSSEYSNLADLETTPKWNYRFSLSAGSGSSEGPFDCRGRPTRETWYAAATPVTSADSYRSFATATGQLVWSTTNSAAPTEPFGPPARPVE
jgi:type II secretory pathway pseudopilin PulG